MLGTHLESPDHRRPWCRPLQKRLCPDGTEDVYADRVLTEPEVTCHIATVGPGSVSQLSHTGGGRT